MKKLLVLISISLLVLAGCSTPAPSGGHIKLADAGWDSIRFHNAVVGFVAENVFDTTWEEVPGSTPITYEALKRGDLDVYTEFWADNIPSYKQDVADGLAIELGINFNDNAGGLYVPAYVIYGDAERGIEAVAPDLRTVEDLKKYAHIFSDPEDPGKGRLYGSIPGWLADEIFKAKWEFYGLNEMYNYFSPGSDAALAASFTAAYIRGEAMVGYYWEPTWLMGLYDFVLLEDRPYTNEEDYLAGKTEVPAMDVLVVVRPGFAEDFPEITAFLQKYQTSSALTSDALAYINETDASYEEAARWFIKNNIDIFEAMLTAAQFTALKEALD